MSCHPPHNTQPDGATKFSTLEGMPHNKVHNCIGDMGPIDPGPYGNMTNFLSPVDPIFFLHPGSPWDIAEACVYLTAPSGKFVTGEMLTVDSGGHSAGSGDGQEPHRQGHHGRQLANLDAMCRAVELNGYRPVVDQVFDLDHAHEAVAAMKQQTHFGKIVIRIADRD